MENIHLLHGNVLSFINELGFEQKVSINDMENTEILKKI